MRWLYISHPVYWTCSFVCHFKSTDSSSPAAISSHWTYHTHCHLCPARYSFTPESGEACQGGVHRPKTQHRNNVLILKGVKHSIFFENLAPSGARDHTDEGRDIGKASPSNQVPLYIFHSIWLADHQLNLIEWKHQVKINNLSWQSFHFSFKALFVWRKKTGLFCHVG